MATKTKRRSSGERYAAKLLFQFRVMLGGDPGIRRRCEERIINFRARSGRAALRTAKAKGRAAQYSYKNCDGNPVHFEFVGILDLQSLEPECEAEEVWYDIVWRVRPMERRQQIIPEERDLCALAGSR